MVTVGGFILSGGLGLLTRRLQVSLIGKTYPKSYNRLIGYGLSSGLFVGSYYFISGIIERNRQLLERRLDVLREQRAKQELFNEFTKDDDHRITASKREGRFFRLFDKYGAPYK